MSKTKQKIKVGFTKAQHEKVHAFLDFIKPVAEKDLGSPVHIVVDWSDQNEHKMPHIQMTGTISAKMIPLKDVLDADDSKLKGPVLKVIDGGKDGE